MTVKIIQEYNTNINFWTPDVGYALGFYRILGRALGIWPLDQKSISAYVRLTFVVITQLSMSLSLIALLLTKGNCGAITDIADVLSLITSGFLSTLKVLIPSIYYYKMYIIVNTVVEDWNQVSDQKSRSIMMKYAHIGRIMFITLMTGVYAVGSPLIIFRLPFVENLWGHNDSNTSVHSVPIGPDCWVSSDISTFHYIAYYIIQSIQLLVTCTAYIGGDTYFFGIAMHVCGQYEILSASFESLNHLNDNNNGNNIKRKDLSKLIRRHQHLLVLVNSFENVYNVIILGQVLGDTLLMSITCLGLLINLQLGDTMITLQLIIRIHLLCAQLFIYCYVGEQLSMHVQKLGQAIYNSDWFKMPYRRVLDMKFVFMRANYPFYLTAGKMYNMNHENFTNIIKGMGSYFSILRLMFIEEA